jgi:hypothetical protein
MMEPAYFTRPLGDCFGVHRKLYEAAENLARQLYGRHADSDLLQLGATCMRIASHDALQASDPRRAIRSWRECLLAERQIRMATFRALRDGCIRVAEYDQMFMLAMLATRIREDERQRLRRKLQYLDLV